MQPQQKKTLFIVGGVAAAIVLVIVLFSVVGGPSCSPNKLDDKNKPAEVKADSLETFKNENNTVKINARVHFTIEEGDKDKQQITYFILSEAKKISGVSNKVDVEGTCIKKITLNVDDTGDKKKTIKSADVEIAGQEKLDKDKKSVFCTAQIPPIEFAAGQYYKCENAQTYECKDKDGKKILDLVIPILFFGDKDADFTKTENAKLCSVKA